MNPSSQSHNFPRIGMVRAGNPRRNIGVVKSVIFVVTALIGLCAGNAFAGPALVIEMPSGAVLYEDRAAEPWYPASLTKLMTAYVALSAVRDHRITLDTPIVVSARAASMPPSKMGFRPGTLVTLDNALKMLMVKSANDMAVTIAEGVSGSVEAFAHDMNETAHTLGLTQSHFVNPNGLPHPEHVSSARDLAILARALFLTFPEHAALFNIGALQLDGKIIRNHNDLLGRYPGADGMKTGFTCAAGFNIVASATQGGRKLIAVILGAPNVHGRAMMAATLFDRAFTGIDKPSKTLADIAAAPSARPPDMHQAVCRSRGKTVAQYGEEVRRLTAPLLANAAAPKGHLVLTTTEAFARPSPMAMRIAMVPPAAFNPIPVHVGPEAGYSGLVAQARPPHSPIGTPLPPASVSAYAPTSPETAIGDIPLPPDPKALRMKGNATAARASTRHDISYHRRRLGRQQISRAKKVHAATRHTSEVEVLAEMPGLAAASSQNPATVNRTNGAKAAKHGVRATGKKPEKRAKR